MWATYVILIFNFFVILNFIVATLNWLREIGKFNFNILTYFKISILHAIKTKIIIEVFFILFYCTKSLKFSVCFILIVYLNLADVNTASMSSA